MHVAKILSQTADLCCIFAAVGNVLLLWLHKDRGRCPTHLWAVQVYASTMLEDSMKPWIQTASDTLPPGHGTPMTSAQLALMTLMASIDWDTLQDTQGAFERIKDFAHAHPVHLCEIREVGCCFHTLPP